MEAHGEAFNTGEFFQGAFEMVDDDDTAVLLWLGEDATRPMAERGKTFLDVLQKAKYIDVADLTLPGIPAERGDFTGIVIGALANRLAQHYESVRSHDLGQRHYMFKVEYWRGVPAALPGCTSGSRTFPPPLLTQRCKVPTC